MGIKFRCDGCNKKLHVKAFLAGKRGVCPHCGAKVRIPLVSQEPSRSDASGKQTPSTKKSAHKAAEQPVKREPKPATTSSSGSAASPASTSSPGQSAVASPSVARTAASSSSGTSSEASPAPAEESATPDPIAEAPEAVWYVRPPTGGQYGPADGEIMRRWLDEGRVSGDSLVWREGWDDWKTADAVFPVLQPDTEQTEDVGVAEVVKDEPEQPFAFDDDRSRTRHGKTRLPGRKSNFRNVAIVVVLSIACLGLLVALLIVLQSRG